MTKRPLTSERIGGAVRARAWLLRSEAMRVLPGGLRHCLLGGRRRLLVLGDSHALIFRDRPLRSALRTCGYVVDLVTVGGATVYGLSNPNSATNALERYRRHLLNIDERTDVLVMMGEVDCGFLAWYKVENGGGSQEAVVAEIQRRFREFVLSVRDLGPRQVFLARIPQQTIDSYDTWRGLNGQRRSVSASLQQRTELTALMNRWLSGFEAEEGFRFVDYSDTSEVDEASILPLLRPIDGSDHHYWPPGFSAIIARWFLEQRQLKERDP